MGLILLMPAIFEWLRPKDAQPIAIDNTWSRNDTVFAQNFRRLAGSWWGISAHVNSPHVGISAGQIVDTPVLAQNLTTGPDVWLKKEVWTRENLILGSNNQARALLSDGFADLGSGCAVERWVHAEQSVSLGQDTVVNARVTSCEHIHLERGCQTQLLYAPTIEWSGQSLPIPIDVPSHVRRWFRRRKISEAGRSWDVPRFGTLDETVFVNGDLILDNEADVDFSLVVRGNLYIRKGALIAGNLKAHGDLVVENSAVIGSLTCKGRLVVGAGSSIQGCLMGGSLVWLGDGVIIGRPDFLQAVSGQCVILTGKGVVHGRIHAVTKLIEVQR
jgi:hypothetical protein